jgi:hypothetical protein
MATMAFSVLVFLIELDHTEDLLLKHIKLGVIPLPANKKETQHESI